MSLMFLISIANPWKKLAMGSVLMLLASLTTPSFAASADIKKLSEEIIQLRNQVDSLADEIQASQLQFKGEMNSLSQQIADTSTQINRLQDEIKNIEDKSAKLQSEMLGAGGMGPELTELLQESTKSLRKHIEGSLPYLIERRSADLAKLEEEIAAGKQAPQRMLNRIWAFYEDEIRLLTDNSLAKQTIEIDGKQVLAEVAKTGMMNLYFRTDSGEVGQAVRQQAGWQFVSTSNKMERQAIFKLFENYKKQIRSGLFQVPMSNGGSI